jgi:hypothetical protein
MLMVRMSCHPRHELFSTLLQMRSELYVAYECHLLDPSAAHVARPGEERGSEHLIERGDKVVSLA